MIDLKIDLLYQPDSSQMRLTYEFILIVSEESFDEFKEWLAQSCKSGVIHTSYPFHKGNIAVGLSVHNAGDAAMFKLVWQE